MVPECSDHRLGVVGGEQQIRLEVFPQLCGDKVFFNETFLMKNGVRIHKNCLL